MQRPNGLAFSPDETLLYVVDTPGPGQRTVQVYDVVDHGTTVANRRVFFNAMPGCSDGIRVDTDGNVWCAWSGGEGEDGVAVFAPDGTMIGRILLPERCANVCFGGTKRNRLFMAASQSIYALYVETQGVARRLTLPRLVALAIPRSQYGRGWAGVQRWRRGGSLRNKGCGCRRVGCGGIALDGAHRQEAEVAADHDTGAAHRDGTDTCTTPLSSRSVSFRSPCVTWVRGREHVLRRGAAERVGLC